MSLMSLMFYFCLYIIVKDLTGEAREIKLTWIQVELKKKEQFIVVLKSAGAWNDN